MDRRAYEDKAMRPYDRVPCEGCGRSIVVAWREDPDLALCTRCRKKLAERAAWRRQQAVRA